VPSPPENNLRAVRHGADANPASLPEYVETVEQIREMVAIDCPWLKPSDEPLLMTFIGEYVLHRRATAVLTQMSPAALMKAHKAQQTVSKRARVINELANSLGLSAAGRYRLGLTLAKTEAIRVQPVKTADRAAEVARILVAAGAVQPVVDETIVVDEPEPEPAEVIELRAVEESA
jgi:hypothetical protein